MDGCESTKFRRIALMTTWFILKCVTFEYWSYKNKKFNRRIKYTRNRKWLEYTYHFHTSSSIVVHNGFFNMMVLHISQSASFQHIWSPRDQQQHFHRHTNGLDIVLTWCGSTWNVCACTSKCNMSIKSVKTQNYALFFKYIVSS